MQQLPLDFYYKDVPLPIVQEKASKFLSVVITHATNAVSRDEAENHESILQSQFPTVWLVRRCRFISYYNGSDGMSGLN